MKSKEFDNIKRELARFRRWWALSLAAPIAALGLWVWALAAFAAVWADSMLGLAAWMRLAVVIMLVILPVGFAAHIVFRLLGLRPDEKVALKIESNAAGFRNRVITAVQLNREPEKLYSGVMIQRLNSRVRRELDELPVKKVISPVKVMSGVAGSVFAFGLFAAPFLFSPQSAGKAIKRFLPPYTDPLSAIILDVKPGDATVIYGDKLTISACASLPLAEPPVFSVSQPADRNDEFRMEPAGKCYRHTLSNLKSDLAYRIFARGVKTRQYNIKVLRRPDIKSLEVTLTPPAYSGLPTQKQALGDIEALVGTGIIITGTASKPIEKGLIRFSSGKETRLKTEGNRFSTEFTVSSGDGYQIILLDTDGLESRNPVLFGISALTDRAGHIRIISPARDLTLDQGRTVPVTIEANDDFGVASVRIVGFISQGNSKKLELKFKPDRSVSVAGVIDPAQWNASAGDVLSYYAEMLDTDTVSGPKLSVSETYRIQVTSATRTYEESMNELQSEINHLQSLSDQQTSSKEKLRKLYEELARDEPLNWDRSKQIEQQSQVQQQIQREIPETAKRIEENISRNRENPFFNTEILDRYMEVQRLLGQVVTDRMKESMMKIQNALQRMDPETLKQAIKKLDMDTDKLLRDLDRTISRLKRIQAEQKLWGLKEQARRLAEEQKKLAEETRAASRTGNDREAQRLESKQKKLAEESQKLFEDIKELAKEAKEFNPDMAEALEKALTEAENSGLMDSLNSSAKFINMRNWNSAGDRQQKAEAGLRKLSQTLAGTGLQCKSRTDKEADALLEWIAWDSITLSDKVENLFDRLKKIHEKRQYLDFKQLTEGLKDPLESAQLQRKSASKILARLDMLSRISLQVDSRLVDLAVRAQDELDQAKSLMEEGRTDTALAALGSSMADFNEIARKVLELGQKMAAMSETMSMEAFLQNLESLAGMQAAINQGTLAFGEGGVPLPGQSPNMSLSDLAAQQQMVREGFEKLMKESQGMGDKVDQLGGMAGDMKDIEDSMRNGQVDQRLIDTQRRVYRRMMQAVQALYKDKELAPGYESRTAETVLPRNQGELKSAPQRVLPPFLQRAIERYNDVPVPNEFREPVRRYFDVLYQELYRTIH